MEGRKYSREDIQKVKKRNVLLNTDDSLYPNLLCLPVTELEKVRISQSAFHLLSDTAADKTFPARRSWSTSSDSTKALIHRFTQVSHEKSCPSAKVDALFEGSALLFPTTPEHR